VTEPAVLSHRQAGLYLTWVPPVIWGLASATWWASNNQVPLPLGGLPGAFVGVVLHLSVLHLGLNALVWVLVVRALLDVLSPLVVLPTATAGAVAGLLSYELIARNPAPLVGASASVFALLALLVVVWPPNTQARWKVAAAALCGIETLTVLGVVIGRALAHTGSLGGEVASSSVGVSSAAAHVGGVLCGVAVGLVLRRTHRRRKRVSGQVDAGA
jgi:membrane associated rhomboid family serine protease